jgi:hypothetical protein
LIALSAGTVLAQETGSISGTVTDASGAPLPGVTISVAGLLIPPTTTQSGSNGAYRFPALPPASDYELRFKLEGFQSRVWDQLIVRLGRNTQIRAQLELSPIEETVVVSGESPLVDVSNSGKGNNITERYLQSIPSARDPWVILQQTGDFQTSGFNVGGSASGQQQAFTTQGSKPSDTMWTYDGADVGLSGSGASPTYYDFDAFEEISISTAGNDVSIQTGGVRLNFVTKRGGNSWRGSGRFYHTDGDWQGYTVSDPATGELVGGRTEDDFYPGYTGDSIDQIQDFGIEVGGPIMRNRIFVWGAYGRQLIDTFVGQTPDNTQLTNWHAKVNWHVGPSTVVNFAFMQGSKTRRGSGASAFRPTETTLDQDGASPSYTLKLQHTWNDGHYLETSVNHFPSWWTMEPLGGRNTQSGFDWLTGAASNTYYFRDVSQRSTSVRADGNLYVAGETLDHEIKYGSNYRYTHDSALEGWPGGVVANFYGGPWLAQLYQDLVEENAGRRFGVYAGDTLSHGRLTINAGLRFDVQAAELLPSAVGASPLAPEVLPAVSFPGFDPGFNWEALSPRLGLTYALTENARTIVRLNAARYGSQLRNWEFSYANTTRGNWVAAEWEDLDGDGLVSANEVGAPVFVSPGFDPSNPNDPLPNTITETSPPWTNELVVGIEHEIDRSLAIGANYVFRKHGGFTWAPLRGEDDPSFWEPVVQDVAGWGELTVYQPTRPRSNSRVYKERKNFDQTHNGLEVYARRRFADGWMANASFSFGNTLEHWRGPGSYTDPTNIEYWNGQPRFHGGQNGTWGASRWNLKLSGMVQLPAGISVAGYGQAREGGIYERWVRSNPRAFSTPPARAVIENFGDTRLPVFWSIDLRAEKTFDVGDRSSLHLIVDAFNVTNNDIVLGRQSQQNSPYAGRITKVLQGRTIRLGLRYVLR